MCRVVPVNCVPCGGGLSTVPVNCVPCGGGELCAVWWRTVCRVVEDCVPCAVCRVYIYSVVEDYQQFQ